ncbi:hypothetical protein ACOSQ2_019779 [Xanthoceras sorbifolium]
MALWNERPSLTQDEVEKMRQAVTTLVDDRATDRLFNDQALVGSAFDAFSTSSSAYVAGRPQNDPICSWKIRETKSSAVTSQVGVGNSVDEGPKASGDVENADVDVSGVTGSDKMLLQKREMQPSARRIMKLRREMRYGEAQIKRHLDLVEKQRQELLDVIDAYEVTMEGARIEMEIRSLDRYKRSPTFDGFMYHEYVNGIRESCAFLKDNVAQELLESIDKAILKNEITGKRTLKRA